MERNCKRACRSWRFARDYGRWFESYDRNLVWICRHVGGRIRAGYSYTCSQHSRCYELDCYREGFGVAGWCFHRYWCCGSSSHSVGSHYSWFERRYGSDWCGRFGAWRRTFSCRNQLVRNRCRLYCTGSGRNSRSDRCSGVFNRYHHRHCGSYSGYRCKNRRSHC